MWHYFCQARNFVESVQRQIDLDYKKDYILDLRGKKYFYLKNCCWDSNCDHDRSHSEYQATYHDHDCVMVVYHNVVLLMYSFV